MDATLVRQTYFVGGITCNIIGIKVILIRSLWYSQCLDVCAVGFDSSCDLRYFVWKVEIPGELRQDRWMWCGGWMQGNLCGSPMGKVVNRQYLYVKQPAWPSPNNDKNCKRNNTAVSCISCLTWSAKPNNAKYSTQLSQIHPIPLLRQIPSSSPQNISPASAQPSPMDLCTRRPKCNYKGVSSTSS